MEIRKASEDDVTDIMNLLHQLGYTDTIHFLKEKMKAIEKNPNTEILVYEDNQNVVAFMAIDFVTQLGLKGDFARISYFAVDQNVRSKGIGKEMEEYCVALAKERKCDRIELHCNENRIDAHRFYYRQGYREAPKYFIKKTGN